MQLNATQQRDVFLDFLCGARLSAKCDSQFHPSALVVTRSVSVTPPLVQMCSFRWLRKKLKENNLPKPQDTGVLARVCVSECGTHSFVCGFARQKPQKKQQQKNRRRGHLTKVLNDFTSQSHHLCLTAHFRVCRSSSCSSQ